MNHRDKLSLLKAYLQTFERLPPHAMQQGISQYEFKAALELIYEILASKENDQLEKSVNSSGNGDSHEGGYKSGDEVVE